MKIVKDIQPPDGLFRFLFRIPIHLYRLRPGWLFGSRLLPHRADLRQPPAGHPRGGRARRRQLRRRLGAGAYRRVVSQHSS